MPPPQPLLSEQAAFSKHLFIQGYPLWNPDPDLLPRARQSVGLRIGDVGTVDERGRFDLFFNILESTPGSADSPPDFPSFEEEDARCGGGDLLLREVVSSPETPWDVDQLDVLTVGGTARRTTQYSATLSDDGAHIILPQGAQAFELGLHHKRLFENYARVHGADWLERFRDRLGWPRSNSLYLLTGFHKTCSWSIASFSMQTAANTNPVGVHCTLVEVDERVVREESVWHPAGRFKRKIGPPPDRQGQNNQTIFIRGITVTPNLSEQAQSEQREPGFFGMLFTPSRFMGSIVGDSTRATATERSKGDVIIQHVPHISQASHPSEIINRYLLKKEPSAKIAVTHDNEWITILRSLAEGQSWTLENLENHLEALVPAHYSIVAHGDTVYLRDKGSLTSFGDRSRFPGDLASEIVQDTRSSTHGPFVNVQPISDSRVLSDERLIADESLSHTTGLLPDQALPSSVSDKLTSSPFQSDGMERRDPTSSTYPITHAFDSSQSPKVMPDNAPAHIITHTSPMYGTTETQNITILSPSPVDAAGSNSPASTYSELFSSDDEVAIGHDCSLPVVTSTGDHPSDVDEHPCLVVPALSTSETTLFDETSGNLPTSMVIPGAVRKGEAYNTLIWQDRKLAVRHSRSLNDAGMHHSLRGGADPTVILPDSEPFSRFDWLSQDAQVRSKQAEAGNAYDGLDSQYNILSKRPAPRIRSLGSLLSFVQATTKSSTHTHTNPLGQRASTTLPFEDSFLRPIRAHGGGTRVPLCRLSFRLEKAEGKEYSSRVHEVWSGGRVGRFKVDRLIIPGPQSANPDRGPRNLQRIHIRHVPDPFLIGNATLGPHAIIHKHSRAAAFSIFRIHGLFSSRQSRGSNIGSYSAQTHLNTRCAIMLAPKKVQEQYTSTKPTRLLPATPTSDSAKAPESKNSSIPIIHQRRDHLKSLDSDNHQPTRTTHTEAFGALDPTDFWDSHVQVNNHAQGDSSRFAGPLSRIFRRSSEDVNHPLSGPRSRLFQPPWLITGNKDQQESDRILNELNASFRDVGLLNTHKRSRSALKRNSDLDQIPDDCLYMTLPLWPAEAGSVSAHTEISSTTSCFETPGNRRYLLVYYVPFREAKTKDKSHEKKKAKQTHSSGVGVETDVKSVYLPTFRVVARVATDDELRRSEGGVRLQMDGLAINDPRGDAMSYPTSTPSGGVHTTHAVICHCYSREQGFDFIENGLLELGLCMQEESPPQDPAELAGDKQGGKVTVLTPIGRAAVEMIWLGCLAVTSFGPE